MLRRIWTPVTIGAVLFPAVTGSWIGIAESDDLSVPARRQAVLGTDTLAIRQMRWAVGRRDHGVVYIGAETNAIEHGDTIVVTLRSGKDIAFGEGSSGSCDVDSLGVEDGTFIILCGRCYVDAGSDDVHTRGVTGLGEEGIGRRFVVDREGPKADFGAMPVRFDPGAGISIDVCFEDEGAGVDSITCRLVGPEGVDVAVENLSVDDGCISGDVAGPLPTGAYTLICHATDRVGNGRSIERAMTVESTVPIMTEAFSYPNPFNPDVEAARIHFTLSEPAVVTIQVFDFAGDFVKTLASREDRAAAAHDINWGGEAEDGTALANGVYICRITATDGGGTQEANLKVAIWRE